jgi:hypothetical protein
MPVAPDEKTPGLYYPAMPAEELFKQMGKLREEAQLRIDQLIAFLDATEDTDVDGQVDDGMIDGDFDTEPSLGATAVLAGTDQTRWADGPEYVFLEDCEGDEHDGREPDDDEDGSDKEPDLGWTVDGAIGSLDDRELVGHVLDGRDRAHHATLKAARAARHLTGRAA